MKFVRPGPFGNYTWTKSKAELTDAERAMIEGKKRVADQVLGAEGETMLTEMSNDELLRFVALDIGRATAEE